MGCESYSRKYSSELQSLPSFHRPILLILCPPHGSYEVNAVLSNVGFACFRKKNVRSNISRNVRRTQSFINCNKNVIINKKSDFKRYRRFYFSVQNGSGDAIYPFVYPFIYPIHFSVYQQPKILQILFSSP